MAPYRGILTILVAFSVLTVMSAFVKAASETVPTGQVVFFRAFLSLPIIAAWLWSRGELSIGLQVDNWRAHALRGLVGTVAMGTGFAAISLLPLAEVQAIRFATPVFLVVFAALILGEAFKIVRLMAVILGLAGVLVIVSPRLGGVGYGEGALLGAGLALGSAALAALAQTFVKAMSGTERPEAIAFYFLATASVFSVLTLPTGWVWPDGREAILLIACGVVGGVGQMLLTASYRHAEASTLAPFSYVSILWATVIGFVWFDEIPTWQTFAGAVLVIGSGVIIVLRERRIQKEGTARRKLRAKGMM